MGRQWNVTLHKTERKGLAEQTGMVEGEENEECNQVAEAALGGGRWWGERNNGK